MKQSQYDFLHFLLDNGYIEWPKGVALLFEKGEVLRSADGFHHSLLQRCSIKIEPPLMSVSPLICANVQEFIRGGF